ncbi:ABC transporter ATP-binding protein [Salarchaeum sp. III]|uniref:ABC transporter ATP-binding protein n=1 Tax=Salarchaeum sp. III TaxID=3107927 RepID=UPI002ED84AC5
MTDPILSVDGVEKRFGGITALDGASFDIEPGITGLIGPNGAGKSTMFNVITGFLSPDAGTVEFRGNDITGLRPSAVADRGLVRTFQIPHELPEMTVRENLALAPRDQRGESLLTTWTRGDGYAQDERNAQRRAVEMAERFDIAHVLDTPAGELSGGQRKLLELARALLTDPDLVLLDEPLAGVNPTLENRILDHLQDLASEGYSFLFIEHDIDVIMEHCQEVIVMHQGRVLTAGDPEAVRSDDRVIEAYLGGDTDEDGGDGE